MRHFEFGTPKKLGELSVLTPPLSDLKLRHQIAVIDDQPFLKANVLRSHKFGGFKDEVQLSITDGWVAEDV